MKKLIQFIFLAVLASSSFLLAQSGTRLELSLQRQEMEDRRWKMEIEATNQVTGCRLKDRLEATNQVTGCRLQVAGSNQEDCRERVANNSVPISYLQSSSSYLGVMPKLMMDPKVTEETTRGIIKECFRDQKPVINRIQEAAEQQEQKIVIAESKSSSLASSFSFSEEGGRTTFTADYSEASLISKRAADLSELGAQAHAAGKQNEGNSWDSASKSSQSQLDYHTKAIEAREAEKKVLAIGYEEAAKISQRVAEKQQQSALAFAVGQEEEGHSWSWSGYSLQAKADYEAKAYEAQEAGQLTLAEGYGSAAAISGEAASQWELSAKMKAFGKSEDNYWERLGYSLQAKAGYEVQACEAQIAGRSTLAEGYRKAAVISGEAADQLKLSVGSKAAEKINEVNSLVWLGDTLQSQADYEAQACEAEEAGENFLADKCRNIIEILQKAVEYQKQAVSAFVIGKEEEGIDLLDVGKFLRFKADDRVKIFKGLEKMSCVASKNQWNRRYCCSNAQELWTAWKLRLPITGCPEELLIPWNPTLNQMHQRIFNTLRDNKDFNSEPLTKKQRITGPDNCQHSVNSPVDSTPINHQNSFNSSCNSKSPLADKKSTGEQLEKKTWNAYFLSNASTWSLKSEEALDFFRNSTDVANCDVAPGLEASSSSCALNFCAPSTPCTSSPSASLERTLLEKEILIKGGERDFWRSLADQYKIASNYQMRALKAHQSGKEGERISWDKAGFSAYTCATYQVKALEVEEKGKLTLAMGYREAAAMSQRAADTQKLSAQIDAAGKENESINWYKAGESLQSQANYQAKAYEMQEEGKSTLVAVYRDAVAILEQALDSYRQSAKASDKEKEDESDYWFWRGDSLKSQADYQVKAIEAEEGGKHALARSYRELLAIAQEVAEYYWQAAEASVEGKKNKSKSCCLVSQYLESKVDDQIKAIKKKEKEELEVFSNLTKTDKMQGVNSMEHSNLQKYSTSTASAALFICCEKWLAETNSARGKDKILSDYVVDILKRGADHEVVKVFQKYWDNVVKAHESGDYSLALVWIQVVEGIQQSIKDSIKAFEATENKKEELSKKWILTVQEGLKLAKYREKYIQVADSFENPEIIVGSKKIIEGLESIVTYLRKAAEAYSLGNEQEYDRFIKVADIMNKNIEVLEEAVNAFKKLIDIALEGEIKLSIFWRKVADHDCQLNETSLALEKTTETKKTDQLKIAELWFKIGECYQKSSKYYCKAITNENENIGNFSYLSYKYYRNVGRFMEFIACHYKQVIFAQEKAIQAMAVNQKRLAGLWMRKATQYQGSAKYFIKGLGTIDSDCVSDADNPAINSTKLLEEASESLEKLIRIMEENERELRLEIFGLDEGTNFIGKKFRKYDDTKNLVFWSKLTY